MRDSSLTTAMAAIFAVIIGIPTMVIIIGAKSIFPQTQWRYDMTVYSFILFSLIIFAASSLFFRINKKIAVHVSFYSTPTWGRITGGLAEFSAWFLIVWLILTPVPAALVATIMIWLCGVIIRTIVDSKLVIQHAKTT